MENEQVKQKFPVGMTLILIHIGLGTVGLWFSMLKTPLSQSLSQLGPVLLSGAGAIIVHLVTIGILATIFYGILKRMRWARKLTIGWYIFSILLSLVNLVSLLGNKTMYDSYLQKLPPSEIASLTPALITGSFVFASVFPSIIALIIIIYLARKKDFFVN